MASAKNPRVALLLAIESSCDETAVAHFEAKAVSRAEFEALKRFGDYEELRDCLLKDRTRQHEPEKLPPEIQPRGTTEPLENTADHPPNVLTSSTKLLQGIESAIRVSALDAPLRLFGGAFRRSLDFVFVSSRRLPDRIFLLFTTTV